MSIKLIDPRTLKTWLDKDEALVIDVREPHEYHMAHIPGATLIPLGSLSLRTLPVHTGKKLVIHCHYGKRGSVACQQLLNADSSLEIYHLNGGLSAWINAGYPVSQE